MILKIGGKKKINQETNKKMSLRGWLLAKQQNTEFIS